MITVGSLFSGIGGLELGLECALRDGGLDCETIWQCEAESWCRGILARHWPDAVRYDDVRTVGAHNLAPVDVLCGGSPCTDLSYAGKRAGFGDTRSGLWSEQARIIRELRPRVAVWENVPGARSPIRDNHGVVIEQPAVATVLGDLSACGYDAVWFTLRASDVGAPHRRERLFVVGWMAHPGNVGHERRPQAGRQAKRRSEYASRELDNPQSVGHPRRLPVGATAQHAVPLGASEDVADRDRKGCHRSTQRDRRRGGDGRVAQPGFRRGVDGLPEGLDLAAHRWPARPGEAQHEGEAPRVTTESRDRAARLKALGNSVTPQCSYVVGCVVAEILRKATP